MQELSVVRPEYAHDTLSDTLEIERLKEQKKKQQLAT
jgi:hypothetical protein